MDKYRITRPTRPDERTDDTKSTVIKGVVDPAGVR
jgi:hypothetical protein